MWYEGIIIIIWLSIYYYISNVSKGIRFLNCIHWQPNSVTKLLMIYLSTSSLPDKYLCTYSLIFVLIFFGVMANIIYPYLRGSPYTFSDLYFQQHMLFEVLRIGDNPK